MSDLTNEDRAVLRRMASINGHGCPPGCQCRRWARDFADFLRGEFPGLGDAALARVCLKISGFVTTYALLHDLGGMHVGGLIAGGAVDLAALEIGDG